MPAVRHDGCMQHTTEWSFSWPFVARLESRAAKLRCPRERAEAIKASAPWIPHQPLWRAFGHLCILTIAGLFPILRTSRIHLAERVASFVSSSELATVMFLQLHSGVGPGYLRCLLRSRPGDLFSRLRYPLAIECGRVDEDRLDETRTLLEEALPRWRLVVAEDQDHLGWVSRCAMRALSRAERATSGVRGSGSLRPVRVCSEEDRALRSRMEALIPSWSDGKAAAGM